MRASRVLALVVGALVALGGFGLLLGGAVLGWAYGTQRDADGFFTTSTERLETTTAALTSDAVELGADPGPRWSAGDLATVRIEATSAGERPVFVGIGPERDVEAYLAGVAHDEVRELRTDPFDVTYRRDGGTARDATPPAAQTFWVASDSGTGTRAVTWDLEEGRWAAVVMNADGTAPVAVDVSIGARSDLVVPVAIGLGLVGAAALVAGTLLIVSGAHGMAGAGTDTSPASSVAAGVTGVDRPPSASPVALTARLDPDLSRWQWLVKWLLVIPHLVVLAFLWIAFAVLTPVAGVAILLTGRYPRRIFAFNVGVLRWTWRVVYYATGVLGTDRYPPFTLAAVADYPAAFDLPYPERLDRRLVLVKWWLLALPHYLIIGAVSGGGRNGAGLALGTALALVAAVTLAVTGRYPRGLFDLLVGLHRWGFRVLAYVALLTDAYPPFRLDQGGDEPGVVATPPVPPGPVAPTGVDPAGVDPADHADRRDTPAVPVGVG